MSPEPSDKRCQEILSDLLLALEGVREGKMFGVPGFFVGKKMFACVYEDQVGVKVPEDLAKHLVESAGFAPFQPYGKHKMREWVQFPCVPHEEIGLYEDVLLAAYDYVGSGLAGQNERA
jgi:hypothetical protein